MKILFLCRGNVGRSVFGEYLYNSLTDTKDAVSAGTSLSGTEEPISNLLPKTEFVINAMSEDGLDVSNHVRRNVTKEMVAEADLIIDMAEQETVQDFVKAHHNRLVWTVDDPKGKSLEQTVAIKGQIQKLVAELITDLQ